MNDTVKFSLLILLALLLNPFVSYAQESQTSSATILEPSALNKEPSAINEQPSALQLELEKKVQALQTLAKENNAEAQFDLGMLYLDGLIGVEKNFDTGVQWLEKAATQGYLDAQLALAEIYSFQVFEEAKGKQNDAFKWYQMAAIQGHPGAMHNYAMLLLPNAKTNQDLEVIMQLLTKAAYKGQKDSQFNLGVIYSEQLNWEKAFYWFKAAAEGGNSAAQFRVGVLYHKGLGTTRNDEQAKRWLNLAATHDNQSAKDFLAQSKLK